MSTPFRTSDTLTPSSEGDTAVVDAHELTEEKLASVDKKLVRRKSYGKPAVVDVLPTRTVSDGLSKEHIEQGRVQMSVYKEYLDAASRSGFMAFVMVYMLQQVTTLLGTNTLRSWGEHNLNEGSNRDAGRYLLGYGLLSLLSTILGAVGPIIMWVHCSIRSSRLLHDSVSIAHVSFTRYDTDREKMVVGCK